jgi:translocation and assembly module TamA
LAYSAAKIRVQREPATNEEIGVIAQSRRFSPFAVLLLILCLPVLCRPAWAALSYKTEIVGADSGTEKELEQASQLIALSKRKPASLAALRDRARRDLARLKTVMESEGYYDAGLEVAIDKSVDPIAVTVTVQPGRRYLFVAATIVPPPGSPRPPSWDEHEAARDGLVAGTPARAAVVLATETAIVDARKRGGWPFARIIEHRVVADTATRTLAVTYFLDLGPYCRFGSVTISGLTKLDPAYVRRRLRWHSGAVYDQSLVDKTRLDLVGTGLFAMIAITPQRPGRPGAPADMLIKLKERARRSLTFGGAYDTGQGLEATFGWEHRNLFGHAEDLKTGATVGQSKNAVEVDYRQPDFGATNRDLVASVGFDNEILDAFHTIEQDASIGIDWHLDPMLQFQVSALAAHARVNEITDSRTYTLVGLPATLKLDRSDDPLSPTRGYRIDLASTPYLRALGSQLTFLQSTATGTTYHKIDPAADYVLAMQTMLGATVGTSLAAIPKDHRLYAGGGGSVRGFGYQDAGPLDADGNAFGGRSLFETSMELRIRMTPRLGLVPFFDVGSDYKSSYPDFSTLSEGAGIGLRYYSAIGPIRVDLATPIDPRPGDSRIKVYVGLGQSF